MFAQSFLPTARLLSLLTAAVWLTGCGYGPEETVTLKITGVPGQVERDEIKETLKTMTDGSGHSMSSSYAGGTMNVELAPVSDVQAFADRIDFGTVTSVEGRTVNVAVGDAAENGNGPSDGRSASGTRFDSPQAAFDGLKEAVRSKDPQAISAALTDGAENTMAGTLVFMAGFAALDEEKRPEIETLLQKHGIDTSEDAEKTDLTEGFHALAEPIKDKPAFIAEILAWIDENKEDDSAAPSLINGTLQNLKVEGDTATGTLVTSKRGAERKEPIEFRKVDGGWLVHLPEPNFGPPQLGPPPNNPGNPSSDLPRNGASDSTGGASAANSDPTADVPGEAVSGTLFGRKFDPDLIEFSQGDILQMRQGEDFFADAEIKLFLLLDKGESPAGKSWNILPGKQFGVPHVHASVKKPDGRGRTSEIYTGGKYSLKLSFSEPKNYQLTGRIDLRLPVEPDSASPEPSRISGTFQVEMPDDPSQPPGERHKPFIHGEVELHQPKKEDWLRAGYVGVTTEGERHSNMAGTKAGPELTNSWVEGTTFKPRISRVEVFRDGPAKYRHVRLQPGNYLVYAQWGDEYVVGRWVEVKADSGISLNFELTPNKSGALEVTVPADSKQNDVRLLPLDDEGQLPAAVPAEQARSLAFSLGLKAKIAEGTARFESLRPGRYRLFLSRAEDARDVTVKEGETARVDLR